MLVMTRAVGDAVAIGDRIVVKVLDVQGGRVQLGIEAPRDIKVRTLEPASPATNPKK